MLHAKIVARFADGTTVKGTTNNFQTTGASFYLFPEGDSAPTEIVPASLKAIFFVKSFEGEPEYKERKEFEPDDRLQGRPVEVEFNDGELLTGSISDYNPRTTGFFLFPIDPDSNNQKVFVVNAAVKSVRFVSPEQAATP